jgi:hypothetical protein
MKAREAAMLRRGGTDPESIRDAINDPGGYYANVPAMLGRSRFVGKSIRSREDGKKSPRDPKPIKEATDYTGEMRDAWKRIDAAGRARVKEAKKKGAVWVSTAPRKPGKAAKGYWKMPDGTKVTGAKVNEGYQAKRLRITRKAIQSDNDMKPEVADFMKRSFKRKMARNARLSGGKGEVAAMNVRQKRRSDARKAKHGYSAFGWQGLPEQVSENFGRLLNINKPKRKRKSIFTGKNIVKSAKQIGLIGKKIGKAMSTPMSNMDSMITGRNF